MGLYHAYLALSHGPDAELLWQSEGINARPQRVAQSCDGVGQRLHMAEAGDAFQAVLSVKNRHVRWHVLF